MIQDCEPLDRQQSTKQQQITALSYINSPDQVGEHLEVLLRLLLGQQGLFEQLVDVLRHRLLGVAASDTEEVRSRTTKDII